MQLTINQALQQGIIAHKAGNVQEAERLYRSILNFQPKHPDANHNLGILAVATGKTEVALALFKTALESNPKIEQFWLSYINILIQKNQFLLANEFIKRAKKHGVSAEKLNVLEVKFKPTTPSNRTPDLHHFQQQSDRLTKTYASGDYEATEKLALTITQEFPNHPFAWKVLGAIFGYTDRNLDALEAIQKVLEISPKNASAYNNLGITLQKLGRLEEAEGSYKKAIQFKTDFAEAQCNLGVTLKELGRLDEAKASYMQALSLKADYAEAHYNLGITLRELGRMGEAEACYRRALALRSEYAEPYNNLGLVLQELGRMKEAEACYRQAIALKSEYGEAYNNYGITLKEMGRLEEAETNYTRAIAVDPDNPKTHFNLGVLLFESGRYGRAEEQFDLSDDPKSKGYTIKCSYLQDEESIFFDKFDRLVSQYETNAIIGSIGLCSEVRYGKKRSNPFCNDPLRYVVNTNLNVLCDFDKIFATTARDILIGNSVSYKDQELLNNGIQTAGNIFLQGKVPKTEIESIIRAEIEKYHIRFKDSEEGFIKNWPTSYDIEGWMVSMRSGGNLAPHMHELGWISGSIYIKVPPKSGSNSGNLVLCVGDQGHIVKTEQSQQSVVDVVTGSFCLFPSSLHHYTIPFEGKQDRIVLAFDVVPTN